MQHAPSDGERMTSWLLHSQSAHRKTTILIAEDEETLRELLQNILQTAGYQVLIAPDGRKALELAARRGVNIDLLLTDIVMPEMSGLDLAKAFKATHPGSRIILTSGYPQGMLIMDRGWNFIQKPFFPQRLLEKIREALSSPAEEPRLEEHE